jgi:[acyl-carrier-protein] S-malonyltransferase
MGKIAFLYPGLGSQKVGMGQQLLRAAPELFGRYLTRSNAVTRTPITQYCLEGPAALLNETHIAEPALFAYSLALTDYAYRHGLYPDMVAGHSLGEYTAAVAAGALSFEDGLYLVSLRARLLHEIQRQQPGAMAAVLGLSTETLNELCADISRQYLVTIANWNSPKQTVVSGVEAGVLKLMEVVRSSADGRAIRLITGGALHSPLMAPAQHTLTGIMPDLEWNNANTPLVANITGQPLIQAHKIRQALIQQITNPVHWVSCIETLIASGCDTFIELGSGQVLSKLVRAIAPKVRIFSADTPDKVLELAEKELHLEPNYEYSEL